MRFRVLRHLALSVVVAACGSRTGLFDGDSVPVGGVDASFDARFDARFDASTDALPPIDANVDRDANRTDCPDADTTFIYVVTTSNELFAFVPETLQFIPRGNLNCPAGNDTLNPARPATPFSMAVDRQGVAYVLYTDERIYRVSTLTGACTATPYVPRQSDFRRFGMGYATIGGGPAETLFVAGSDVGGDGARGLARINTTTWALTPVAEIDPNISGSELTGTGDGRLFTYYKKGDPPANGPPSYIGEIDTSTAAIVAESILPSVDRGQGWAFGFWGGDFYVFHSPGGVTSIVTRFRPSDNSIMQLATLPTMIVGAGVSTCAPAN